MENKTHKELIASCLEHLEQNPEWIERYREYAENILRVKEIYSKRYRQFQVRKPLSRYTNITKCTSGYLFDLRFFGQSVGDISVTDKGVRLRTFSKLCKKTGENYFKWNPEKDGEYVDWNSSLARDFRQHFTTNIVHLPQTKSPEHSIENQLLIEFSKQRRNEHKELCYIQPITLYGNFFRMPTPFSASGNSVVYAAEKGGGIDILARVKHSPNNSRLCVCELKDENKESEGQEKVQYQALAYATFIAKLLTNNVTASAWLDIFSLTPQKHLDIDVVTIMPYSLSLPDSLKGQSVKYDINDHVTLHLHSLFFKIREDINDSWHFSGTLKDALDHK